MNIDTILKYLETKFKSIENQIARYNKNWLYSRDAEVIQQIMHRNQSHEWTQRRSSMIVS